MDRHMLTTVDNPYDPFTEYEEWDSFDTRRGYNTACFLARVAYTSHELSESDQDEAIEQAIEQIVSENVSGRYRKVREPKPQVA